MNGRNKGLRTKRIILISISIIFLINVALISLEFKEFRIENQSSNLIEEALLRQINELIGPPLSLNIKAEIFNYTMKYSIYNWINASSGTELLLGDDDCSTEGLPFTFQFYGNSYDKIHLGSNGYLSFVNSTPEVFENVKFPSTNPTYAYVIAPFWDDIYIASAGGFGNIYVKNLTKPNRWVAEWYNVSYISNNKVIGTFELILYETGEIKFQYKNITYVDGNYTTGLNLGSLNLFNYYQGLTNTTTNLAISFIKGGLGPNIDLLLGFLLNQFQEPPMISSQLIAPLVIIHGIAAAVLIFVFFKIKK